MPPPLPDAPTLSGINHISSLQAALDSGTLVLTPTALAAGTLRTRHDQRRRAAGHTVWQPANVFSWQQWLGSIWTGLILNGRESRLLLNTAQEELLWREIAVPTLDAASLASAPGFATLARSGYALAASYGLTSRLAAAANTEDTQQFARWAADFTRTCGRHGYLPAALLPLALADHLTNQAFPPPAELHLTGFLDLPPADTELLDALRRSGTQVIEHPAASASPETRLTLRAPTETDELRAIAQWLRNFLDDYLQSTAPLPANDTSSLPAIHVVLTGAAPDLGALDSIFREILAPELDLITADPTSAPWEFAAGRPLAAQPLISTVVRLLRGLSKALPLDDITALLLSPHLGHVGNQLDRDSAAQFDAWALRDRPPLRPELTFSELQRLAKSSPYGRGTLAWLSPLLSTLRETGDLALPRPHAAWTTFVRDLATSAGWPGTQPLTPAEFAATEAWEHLLDSIATLDFTGRRVPFSEALAALEHQLASAAFSLPTHPPIRILSAADAAATSSDVLVLLQATETNWPPAARAHPLLPWHLQAANGMPGAHPAHDAARAQRLTDALLNATPHVLLTHAHEANEAPQRLAPALAHVSAAPPWRELDPSRLISSPAPLVIPEQVIDDSPLPSLPSPQVPGGARVLQLQAACGFRAFAEIRLRSTEPRSPDLGLDAGRAGSLLHHALDIFWQRVRSQSALLALSPDECDQHLSAAIEKAFARHTEMAHSDDNWDKAFRALQMERLFDLLQTWLGYERDRAPFTVQDREQERHLTVGPLELQLRIDRIDSVENGAGTVLIDYKTGLNAKPSDWESNRPDEPQLPLYTLSSDPAQLRGLAFARIRRGQFTWSGVQAEPGLLGKARLEPDLDQLVAAWQTVLTNLARQFASGDHSVNPKSYPHTCTYCGQRFLCRVDPNTLLALSDEEDEVNREEEAAHG